MKHMSTNGCVNILVSEQNGNHLYLWVQLTVWIRSGTWNKNDSVDGRQMASESYKIWKEKAYLGKIAIAHYLDSQVSSIFLRMKW